MESAPSSCATVTLWLGEARLVQLSMNTAALLREVLEAPEVAALDLALPAAAADGTWAPDRLRPYDGSSCGEAVLLGVEALDKTLQALGWFPSGVLVLRPESPTPARTERRPNTQPPPSALFEAVARRHEHLPALNAGQGGLRIATTAAKAPRLSEAAAKADAARIKAERAKDKKTATQLWHMLARRAATGRESIREEDRYYLVVEGNPTQYVFFPKSASAAKALEGINSLLDTCGHFNVALDPLLPLSDQLPPFAVVRLVDRAPEVETDAAVVRREAAAPPDEESAPDPTDDAALPIVVKFGGGEHRLVDLGSESTVGDLRASIARATGLEPARQTLVCKAAHLLDDPTRPLARTNLHPNARIILMTKKQRR